MGAPSFKMLGLHPLDILSGASIDFDPVAFVQKQRNIDRCPGLHGGRLRAGIGTIPTDAWYSLFDFEFNSDWQLYSGNIGPIEQYVN